MFDYDPAKSAANLAKHGIDFEQARALWDDDARIMGPTYAGGDDERWMVVGKIDGKLWSAAITVRDGLIRIISVRRSRPKEEEAYERQED